MAKGIKTGGGSRKGKPNKANADLRAIAQQYTKEAVEKLVAIMRNGESEQARVAATKEILDRGHGKASQPLEHSGNVLEGLLDAISGKASSSQASEG